MANTKRGWEKGVVVDLWYMEESFRLDMVAPYQIKLEKDDSLIFSLFDSDSHVKPFLIQNVGEGKEVSLPFYKRKTAELKAYSTSEKSLVGRKVKLR
jgi:hypothetical protein